MPHDSADIEVSEDTGAPERNGGGEESRSRPDEISEALARMEAAVEVRLEAWEEAVRSGVAPLQDAMKRAADRHRRLIEELPAEHPLRYYRNGLIDEVVRKLRADLAELGTASRIEDARAALDTALEKLAADQPDALTREEPDQLYRRHPSDSLVRRVRKAGVLTGRRWRRARRRTANMLRRAVGRQRAEAYTAMQTVPLKELASYHLQVRVPELLSSRHAELQQVVGEAVAAVARSLTEHVHGLLDLERLLVVRERRPEPEAPSAPTEVEAVDDERAAVLELAPAFGAVLENAKVDEAVDAVLARAASGVRQASQSPEWEAGHAGSFMMDFSRRSIEREAGAVKRRAEERARIWAAWHERARTRMTLAEELLRWREVTMNLEESLVRRVTEVGVRPAVTALEESARSLRRLLREGARAFDKDGMTPESISDLLDRALASVDVPALSTLRDLELPGKAREAGSEIALELAETIGSLPERLDVSAFQPEGEALDPEAGTRPVALRDHAARAFDALLLEKLRSAAAVVGERLVAARREAETVPGILRFNLDAAEEELSLGAGSDAEPHLEATRELALGGLSRSADVLQGLAEDLAEASEPLAESVRTLFDRGYESIHERLRVEARLREQMLDIRSEIMERGKSAAVWAAERARGGSVYVRRAYQRGMRQGRALVRLGQAAAGLAEATEEERLEMVEALAGIDRLLENLPIVYRRLFTFSPVTDPSLLEGREVDLEFVGRHAGLWERGVTDALVLTGYQGSGLTSFLNVLHRLVLKDFDVRMLDLRERVREERDLAAKVARAIGLKDAGLTSLDAVAGRLSRETEREMPLACFIEHLEHVFLREVGGTALVDRFLTFLSRTDSRVLWIVSSGDYGWQVIQRAEPSAAALVFRHRLSAITRPGLEYIVMNRHRRSGLPLRFEAPSREANPILRRKYSRAKTEAERQALLQTEFFDRLSRASGQNIMLALLYWLRSVEMDTEDDTLVVHPLNPLSFSVLHTFDLPVAFTLKALLEHATLTVQEHSEIFQVPVEVSLQTFEALGNLLLIEPQDVSNDGRSRFAFSTVEEGIRYGVRPLLVHPIMQYLRGKNIIH